MKKYYMIVFSFLIAGCGMTRTTRIVGNYKSNTILYGEYEVVATFNPDGSFIYYLPFNYQATGNWHLSGDTLVLHSEKFQTDTLAPSYKCTDLEGKTDAYLVKGRKLYVINKTGWTKLVYLKKIQFVDIARGRIRRWIRHIYHKKPLVPTKNS